MVSQDERVHLEQQLEIVTALILATDRHEEVAALLVAAADPDEAVGALIERFGLSEVGAHSVLNSTWRRLTAAERQRLHEDRDWTSGQLDR